MLYHWRRTLPEDTKITLLLPVAWVLHSCLRGNVHVRRQRLVHKSPEAHAKVAGCPVHGLSQTFAQCPQSKQVIVHGVGQVHEVVKIHRVVLHLTDLHCEALGIIWNVWDRVLLPFLQRCCVSLVAFLFSQWLYLREKYAWPGLRVMWSLWGLIWVTSCVAPAALLLKGWSSITCSLLLGDSRDDGAQPAATRLLFRSQRDELAKPWPKSWQEDEVI